MRSRLYHHSKYDCDVKNTLVILPDGSTVVTVVRAEANIVLDTKYGYSEVSNFKVKFTTPSEDGTTIYHYNPITNRIKSGIRTYKHVKIKNTAPCLIVTEADRWFPITSLEQNSGFQRMTDVIR